MPTPFYHLSIAEELLQHPELPAPIRQQLETYRCAFWLGNTAPDVQTFSKQKREETHFFNIPLSYGARHPWGIVLKKYPSLARPQFLPHAQAVFLAGYLCHLQADWMWIKSIYLPYFGPACLWGTFRQRLYLHNVLRTQLDFQAYNQIISSINFPTGACLETVEPAGWLPFIDDHYLKDWRDFLTVQLQPGGRAQTVEVFAERQGIPPEAYYQMLGSPDRMEQELFTHLPYPKLENYRRKVVGEGVKLLLEYLKPTDEVKP